MTNYDEDYEYASEKLPKTIVRLKDGIPVFVHEVLIREKFCEVFTLKEFGKPVRVKLKDLNLKSPPLGFVNFRGSAAYLMRIPKRRDWKQGLRAANCLVDNGDIPFNDLLRSAALHNCIIGKYPTLHSILKKIKRIKRVDFKIAWGRHWAIGSDYAAYYKQWGKIGTIEKSSPEIVFESNFSFLRESFEESLVCP